MFIDIFFSIWFCFISLISIPANILMVVLLMRKRSYEYYYLLLISQAIRDLLFNVIVNFYTIATLANGHIIFGQVGCRFAVYSSRVWYFGTSLTLSAATVERCNSIKNCLTHNAKVTKVRLLTVIFGFVLVPFVAALPVPLGATRYLHLTTLYGCENDENVMDVNHFEVVLLGTGILVIFLILPSTWLLKTSVNMFLLVKRHHSSIHSSQPGEIASVNNTAHTKRCAEDKNGEGLSEEERKIALMKYKKKAGDVKIAKNVLLNNAGFLLTLLPILILKFSARYLDRSFSLTPKITILIVYWLSHSCTIWNAMINVFRRNDLRNEAKKTLKRCATRLFGVAPFSLFQTPQLSSSQVNIRFRDNILFLANPTQ